MWFFFLGKCLMYDKKIFYARNKDMVYAVDIYVAVWLYKRLILYKYAREKDTRKKNVIIYKI